MIPEGAIISGFISKIINDVIDVTKDKIRKADKDRKAENQNFETRIYQVIIDAINEFTYGKYVNQDIVYDAAEKMLNGFKNGESNIIAVKTGLINVVSNVDESGYEKFIRVLCHEISRENNFDVYKEIVLTNQGQETKYNHDILQKMDKKLDYLSNNITEKNNNFQENDNLQGSKIKQKVKSRTQGYADKWNANMFLNDFDKRDENAGVNVKLRDVYLDEHLPHYIWCNNENERSDLKDLLSEYIYEKKENKMLLILGQPGIGKSTLITWIIANFINELDNILVYQFASDLKNIDWQYVSENYNVIDDILMKLNLSYNDLQGKTLIFDGFDEVSISNSRKRILDCLYEDWIYDKRISNFSLIITCRVNYVEEVEWVKCKYIILQPWNERQIKSFCDIFQAKTKNSVSNITIKKLIENREILGIPLILYMTLALDISVEKEGSIVDIYDKIFSLDGGIYDRCINNKNFSEKHRIGKMKEQIHQISREIAIWMFENNPDEAYIPQKEYQKICNHIMKDYVYEKEDFKIGNYFKTVKHCEGMETEELYFVHRSIYEYFVAETIFNSIENSLLELTDKSKKKLAGNMSNYLKKGHISHTIGEFLSIKLFKVYNSLSIQKQKIFYQWWEDIVCQLLDVGMFFYSKKSIHDYKNIINKEITCFLNLIEILRLVLPTSNKKYIMQSVNRQQLYKYIKFCVLEYASSMKNIDCRKMCLMRIELAGENLTNANFQEANLFAAYFSNSNLMYSTFNKADLRKADLREVDLRKANLEGADLRGTKLIGTIMDGVRLEGSVWFMRDVKKSLSQLKEAEFVYIIVERQEERKKVYRSVLFPDEK